MKVSKENSFQVKALDEENKKVVTFDCVPCPNCKKWIIASKTYKYCHYCGERLEWEEE